MAKVIKTADFDMEVMKSDQPVIVDFFAEWCGPCKMLAPILEEISVEASSKIKVVKIDVDSNRDIAQTYGVRSIPTMVFFNGGEVKDKVVGLISKAEIMDKINAL